MPNFLRNINLDELLSAASLYTGIGYSVIPVRGNADPSRAKASAIPWREYQQRIPRLDELQEWFSRSDVGGLALVTGAVSRLMVLDFDSAELAKAFELTYPHLLETRTMLSASRGLPHYYFHLPVGYALKSRSFDGVDVQAEGRYIIAPPTYLGDAPYQIKRGGRPKSLTIAEIEAILRFFSGDGQMTCDAPQSPSESRFFPLATSTQNTFSSSDAVALYRHMAPQIGRNNALFRVACHLRDLGWSSDAVLSALGGVHAHQPPNSLACPEPLSARHQEARRSILSVYSRPPRRAPKGLATSQLPNVLREYLVRRGLVAVARVLDGLLLMGIVPGQSLSERIIKEKLSQIVGRHSILNALRTLYPDGTPIFAPSPRPPTPATVATETPKNQNNKCLLFTATKSDKNRRGRPPKQYIIPTIFDLCAKFGLKPRSGDVLRAQDVKSARSYRIALHREWIRRCPGMYYRSYMARRLGLSVRTLQRYDRAAHIGVAPLYQQVSITWDNLALIPVEDPPRGTFLSDERGKRYPPLPAIAMRLLKKRHKVTYQRQVANYYWVGIMPKGFEKVFAALQISLTRAKSKSEPVHIRDKPVQSAPKPLESPPSRRNPYRRALDEKDKEQLALRFYECVRELALARGQAPFSRAVARRLVFEYPTRVIEETMTQLRQRHNIQNPAGFAIILVRGSKFAVH